MRKLKCVLVGDEKVGKTSLLITYTTNRFPSDSSNEWETSDENITVGGEIYTVSFHEAVKEMQLRPVGYNKTDVFLVCFSVVCPASFQMIKLKWVSEIKYFCKNVPFLLIGLQTDLRDDAETLEKLATKKQKPITYEQGDKRSRELKAVKYVECSALTQMGLKDVFNEAILAALEPPKSQEQKKCIAL